MSDGAWLGGEYAAINGLQRELARRSLAGVAWRGDERVLDVGCGDGAITAQVADLVPGGSVLGVDVSPDQIAFAAERNARPNLAFAVGDAAALDLAPAFDAVVSFNALHWVHDLASAFRGLRRASLDGARLTVRMVCEGERRSLEHVLMETAAAPRWRDALSALPAPFEHRAPEELADLAHAAGFDVAVEVEDAVWDFGSRDAFAAWGMGTMRPWTSVLPEASREAFVRAAVDAYAEQIGEAGTFRFLQCLIAGTAV